MDFKISTPDTTEAAPFQPFEHVPEPLTPAPPAGPAPTPERNFQITILSRYRNGGYYSNSYPDIRFGGKYLEAFKFPIGTRLLVTVKKGRIIIRPHLYQPWLPEDIANEVREASGNDDT